MSKRYIDADALCEHLQNKLKTDYEMGLHNHGALTESFIRFVERQPTADAVEVRHGYWKWEKKIEPQAQNRLYCSICDNECLSKGNYYAYSTYCPYCGAKMDGKRRDENEG